MWAFLKDVMSQRELTTLCKAVAAAYNPRLKALLLLTIVFAGAKPFLCPDCDQRFRTSGQRKTHMASHHAVQQDATAVAIQSGDPNLHFSLL